MNFDGDTKEITKNLFDTEDIEFDDLQNSTRPTNRRIGINGEEWPFDMSPKDFI